MDDNSEKLTIFKLPYDFIGYNIVNSLVLYPVKFSNNSNILVKKFSLVRSCCVTLTRNSDLLRKVCAYIPVTLYYILLTVAEIKEYDQSIAVLMSNWPYESLSVFEVISRGIECLRTGQLYEFYYTKYLKRFLKVITDHSTPRLRILDLRGMCLRDYVLHTLISQILFIYHDDSLPDDYHIIIDCEIRDSLDDLKSLLKITSECETKKKKKKINIKLHINTLIIDNLADDKFWGLLEEINPNELIGLSCPVDFTNEAKISIIKRFTSLVAFYPRGRILSIQYLHQLRRLQLDCGNLSEILDVAVSEKLEYLDISNQGLMILTDVDFRHLISIQLKLRELNLSWQEFGDNNWRSWSGFLRSLASTLKILKLKHCVQDINLFPNFVNCILPLVNLRYLNLRGNELTIDVLQLTALPVLECIRLSKFFKFFVKVLPDQPRDKKNQIEFEFNNKSPPVLVKWL